MKLSIILKAVEKEVEKQYEVISITKLQNNETDIVIIPQYLISVFHKINKTIMSFVIFIPTTDNIKKVTKEIQQELRGQIN